MDEGGWKIAPAPLKVEVKVLLGGEPGGKGGRIPNAAFEQIRPAELLNPQTATPNGTLIARIHKPSGGCSEKPGEGEHVHVLWQEGAELRFSCVRREPWERTRQLVTQRTAYDELRARRNSAEECTALATRATESLERIQKARQKLAEAKAREANRKADRQANREGEPPEAQDEEDDPYRYSRGIPMAEPTPAEDLEWAVSSFESPSSRYSAR